MENDGSRTAAIQQRRRWMSTLALSSRVEIEQVWGEAGADTLAFQWLRKPHTGLVMIRGRAGGTGSPFNLGELTVSRCALQLACGTVGHAYVQGRDHRHAELAAKLDALLQKDAQREELLVTVIEPLRQLQAQRRLDRSRKAAATRVEFFTMVRGENAK